MERKPRAPNLYSTALSTIYQIQASSNVRLPQLSISNSFDVLLDDGILGSVRMERNAARSNGFR